MPPLQDGPGLIFFCPRLQVLSDEIAAKVAEGRKLDSEERCLQQQQEELRRAKKRLLENAGRLRQLSIILEDKQATLQVSLPVRPVV
ncbi:hypothetical protein V5799_015827 [Amblyomma americanum]|uniref:Uncharacterized protein n=1 Tax=Amblyomma americanum TaxID=6943 RepID=A0AAQ4F7I0_AMBAM